MTFSPNISPEEEKIDWNKSAREIFNKVRGMNPFPVAHTTWNGERFKIYEQKLLMILSVTYKLVKLWKNEEIIKSCHR